MAVRSQSAEPGYEEFVENAMWLRGGVVFATVHLIGLTRPPTDPDVASRRMDAALAWINATFTVARDSGSAGVFIATQVDPWIVWGLPFLTRRLCDACVDPRNGLERLYVEPKESARKPTSAGLGPRTKASALYESTTERVIFSGNLRGR